MKAEVKYSITKITTIEIPDELTDPYNSTWKYEDFDAYFYYKGEIDKYINDYLSNNKESGAELIYWKKV